MQEASLEVGRDRPVEMSWLSLNCPWSVLDLARSSGLDFLSRPDDEVVSSFSVFCFFLLVLIMLILFMFRLVTLLISNISREAH